MISDRKCAPEARCLAEMVTAGSANIRLASTAPPMQPATWAGRQAAASRQDSRPNTASAKDTTGLRWPPETGPNIKMLANSPAAVAAAFSISSSPVWPGESRCAAMPDPITTAARNALPRSSAVSRRQSGTGALLTPLMLTEEDSSVKIESMSIERNSDLARRAAVHAALADPARLAITDTLLAGDASPSELAGMLAMPSNLLAHHLHVLEQAGVITRRRSEGDRRRTYLRLVPSALHPLARPPRGWLFVCTANSARSHLAAALWRRASTIPAASAGTHPGPTIDPGAIAAARRHRLPLPRPRPRPPTPPASTRR